MGATPKAKTREILQQFRTATSELVDLRGIMNALSWDQETMMPKRGGRFRAHQVATLASVYHQKLTHPDFGTLLEELEGRELGLWDRASLREAIRDYRKALKLPPELVREIAKTTTLAYEAWVKAREDSDFKSFSTWLQNLIGLKRQEARCLSDGGELYEALLDEYEPAMTAAELDSLFLEIRPRLSDLVDRIRSSPRQPDINLLRGHFPHSEQEKFGRDVLTSMGFDWQAGRLDTSPHPFCSGVTPLDVRITTRYSPNDFTIAFFGMVHEGGHALYEQGLDIEHYGLPACDTISLGIHESQSRFWENNIARSRPFWEYWYPRLRKTFGGHFSRIPLDDFLHAVNHVDPGPIRVEADEVTYGLHVILRYEIEKALLEGETEAEDLERVWNQKMEEYLDLKPKNAAEGVLQDVHWSHGLVGYFPTYVLGTLYAAQLQKKLNEDLPDLEEDLRCGQLEPIREWLREKVHRPGKTLGAGELIEQVTGEPLRPDYFLDHLERKYGDLYGL